MLGITTMTLAHKFATSSGATRRDCLSGTIALILVPAVIAAFRHRLNTTYVLQKPSARGRQTAQSTSPIVDDNAEAERFFAQHARPILQATAQKNQDAIARARDNLGKSIDGYRTGIEPFITDLRSWTTEYHIFINLLGGWWHKDERLLNYIYGKIRRYLFSEDKICFDVTNAFVELRDDIEAHENRLLVNLRNDSTSSDLATPPEWPDIDVFSEAVSARALRSLGSIANDSVAPNAFASMGTTLATETVVPAIVGAAAKAAATSVGKMIVGEIGVVAAETGASTAAGSEVPIIGNVVGICVGLVAAVLAQHFAEAAEDEMLRRDLNRYIDGLKAALVGNGSTQSELTRSMDAYVKEIDQAEADVVKQTIFSSRKGQLQ